MRSFIVKYVFVLILILQTTHIFSEVVPSFKHYNGAIISTLSLGLALQTAGVAFFMYSNNYFLSEISPLQIEYDLQEQLTKQIENKLKKKREVYNNYFISSITLFSVGTVSTIVGLGLILSRSINDWKKTNTKSTFNKKTYHQLQRMSSIQFTPNVSVSIPSLYPTVVTISIQ